MRRLTELDLSEIIEWPRKLQVAVLLILFLIIQLLLYWLVILPELEQRSERLIRISEKQSIVAIKSGRFARKEELQTTLNDKYRRLINISHASFGGKTQVDLLSMINQFASSNRLTVEQIQRNPPVVNDFYVQHFFDIQLSGRFEDFGEFFNFIANVATYIGFESIDLLKGEKPSSEVKVRIRAVIYFLGDEWQESVSITTTKLDPVSESEQVHIRSSFNYVFIRDLFEFSAPEPNISMTQQKCTESYISSESSAIEAFKLSELSLKGFLRSKNRKAALIQTPDGKVVSVKEGDFIGDEGGYVLSINQNDLLIYETVGGCESHKSVYWPKRSVNIEVSP